MLNYKTTKTSRAFSDILPKPPIHKSHHDNTSSPYPIPGKPDMWKKSKNAIQNSFWKVGVQIIHIFIHKYPNEILP